MGVTVHFQGSIADLDRITDFEDRVIDLALEMGALARIWRSSDDDDPRRTVKGLIVDLSPGQDSTSLLLSPEGWLIPLFEIEAAEKGALQEPPWIFVKTQFGSVEGHVALIELLAALKDEYFPDLKVSDEGNYWETRDLDNLVRKFSQVQTAIDGLAEGLRQSPLSSEAAKDPSIVARRIERVARLVQQTMARPPEHPPVQFDDSDLDGWNGIDEAKWDKSYKEQRRKQERMHRAIEEELQRGEDHGDAFENAMRNEGLIDLPGEEPNSEFMESLAELDEEAADEPWKESLPEAIRSGDDEDTFDDESFSRIRHPLQERVMDLYARLHDLFKDMDEDGSSHVSTLMSGVGDIVGGLAQALGTPRIELDGLDSGLSLVQLKRALRGAAFARGALHPLRAEGAFDDSVFDELDATLKELETGILAELASLRGQS
jgi:hypothetical protein